MLTNPYFAEQLARERMQDALREAEQSRLLRRRAPGQARRVRWLVAVAVLLLAGGFLSGLL